MKRRVLLPLVGCSMAVALVAGSRAAMAAGQAAAGGTIVGHVKLMGTPPGNAAIRMGMDPVCAKINSGKRIFQEIVLTTKDGGLANVFVNVQGSFPKTPVPTVPVTIDQQGCTYRPHMVGARVGQTLQIKNSDETLHNLHSVSTNGNGFNVGQPKAGMVFQYQLKGEEAAVHLICDVHRWMASYIGVVNHPYFTVSGEGGGFTIPNVPAGKYMLHAWHERYGPLTQSVQVRPGMTTTVDFSYTGTEKATARADVAVQDVVVPAGAITAQLLAPAPRY
jgi:plastocyanin